MKGEPVDVNVAGNVIDWRAAHARTIHAVIMGCHLLRSACLISESSQLKGLST